jgi:hypothetical protein
VPKLDPKQQLNIRQILAALREAAGYHELGVRGLGAAAIIERLEAEHHVNVCIERGYCRVLQDGLRSALELDGAH